MSEDRVSLGFLSLWLVFWSFGVAVIEGMVIQGDYSALLFLFTHGGAQVGVLLFIAHKLMQEGRLASTLPVLDLQHDRLEASWTVGQRSVLRGLFAALVGLVAHGVVMGGAGVALSQEPSTLGVPIGLLALLVWAGTAVWWTKAVWSLLESGRAIELSATLDGVRVDGASLPLEGLKAWAYAGSPDLTLESQGQRIVIPCVASPARGELVDFLTLMSGKGGAVLDVPVPDAMQGLRAPVRAPE